MPKKSTQQSPKQSSQLLAIIPRNPAAPSTSEAEPPHNLVPEASPQSEPALLPKPPITPELLTKSLYTAELVPNLKPEAPETPATDSDQPPKKVVSVVPRKVQEAKELGIELEEPPEEIVIPEGTIFQAVGIISADITFVEEEERVTSFVTLQGKQYPLFYVSQKRRAYEALKKEIAATGKTTQRIIVYPKFTHYPGRDQDYTVAFQLVGFDTGQDSEGISTQLQDMEFQLCGLWQFIPVCRTPCISVFKNFTRERLDFIKQSETIRKVKFMKASHLPLFWRDTPVPPFRFNPKAPKEEQGKPVFIQVKARFSPRRDAFEFESLLGVPLQKPPSFLKASKADKATAMAEKKAKKLEREAAERAAEREARRVASGAATRPQPKPKPKPKPQ